MAAIVTLVPRHAQSAFKGARPPRPAMPLGGPLSPELDAATSSSARRDVDRQHSFRRPLKDLLSVVWDFAYWGGITIPILAILWSPLTERLFMTGLSPSHGNMMKLGIALSVMITLMITSGQKESSKVFLSEASKSFGDDALKIAVVLSVVSVINNLIATQKNRS